MFTQGKLAAALLTGVLILTMASGAQAQGAGKGGNPSGKPFIALDGRIVEVEGEISSLQDQIDALVAKVDTIEQRVGANEAAIISLQDANIDLQYQITVNAGEVVSLQAQIDDLELINVSLQSQINNNSGDISALQDQVDSNNLLISNLQQAASDLGTSLQDQIDNNNDLIVVLEDEIESINESLALKQQILSGSCPSGQALREIMPDGTIVCEPVSGGGSSGIQLAVAVNVSFKLPPGMHFALSADCPAGYTISGGGFHADRFWILNSSPNFRNGWFVSVQNARPYSAHFVVYAMCIRPSP